MRILLSLSDKTVILPTATTDPINIFCQYFLPATDDRRTEIQQCLRFNVANPNIAAIYLLNERIYTDDELGVSDPKIIQVDIGRRLRFSDVFEYIATNSIQGYAVIINSDIFLDTTINTLRSSDLHVEKKMMALLRYEYSYGSSIFGPRHDSQDTWIIHSAMMMRPEHMRLFAFEFGKPGCDNKLAYLMFVLGYTMVNDPQTIKTYHIHADQTRAYTIADRVTPPFMSLAPYGYPANTITRSLGIHLGDMSGPTRAFSEVRLDDNLRLHEYVKRQVNSGTPFCIPLAGLLDTNVAVYGEVIRVSESVQYNTVQFFTTMAPVLAQAAGVRVSSLESILRYAEASMHALTRGDILCCHELYGYDYLQSKSAWEYLRKRCGPSRFVWNAALDIFHYIHSVPWTTALQGKRLLIISKDAAKIQMQLAHHERIYGRNLFPDCAITAIGFDGGDQEYDTVLSEFMGHVDKIHDLYDVALVSCGGFGNLICSALVDRGRSAICVGDVLQMYFGILGNKWEEEVGDVVSLYANEFWITV